LRFVGWQATTNKEEGSMNYREALQAIETTKALEALNINYLCQGAYVRFECECGSKAATFKINGEKKNLWYCPDCKKGGNILNFTMAKRGTEYEETKRWLLKLLPTQQRLEKEITLKYELQHTKELEDLGLSKEACDILEIGIPKGKTMLSGCIAFAVFNETGFKIAYYGIRLKTKQPVFHKSFNPELYLYGLYKIVEKSAFMKEAEATLVTDMIDCAVRISKGENAICNFGLTYVSNFQRELLNQLGKVELQIEPDINLTRKLTAYHRYI
jgi:hypothetical protein